jgi:hypothetical protein
MALAVAQVERAVIFQGPPNGSPSDPSPVRGCGTSLHNRHVKPQITNTSPGLSFTFPHTLFVTNIQFFKYRL